MAPFLLFNIGILDSRVIFLFLPTFHMLPSITASKSPSTRIASTSGSAAYFEKSSNVASPSSHPSASVNFAAFDSTSAHGSPDITAIVKTPAVSAKFAAFSSPDRKQRFDVQAMLNEIHGRPSMAGLLGTGIVSALSAKTIADTQTSKPLEVRANLDRFIRSKLQVPWHQHHLQR